MATQPIRWPSLLLAISLCSVAPAGVALQTASDPAQADVVSGLRLLQNRDFAAAKLQFSAAIKANPKAADAFTWRGITENELKQFRDAVQDFDAALRIHPDDLPAHYNLALSLIRLGEQDRAIQQLRQVLKLQPGAPEAEYNLAILLEERHTTSEAIQLLEAANQARPGDGAILQHLAIDLVVAGKAEDAQPMLDQLSKEAPPETLTHVAESLLQAGDAKQAVPLLETARTQSQPDSKPDSKPDPQFDLLLARAYIANRQDAKAIDLLTPVAATDSSGAANYLLGLAYLDQSSIMNAKEAFELATKANPRNGTALYHLALLESAQPQQIPEAIGHLRAALATDPENSKFGVALARLLLEKDDTKGALPILERLHPKGQEAGERDLLLGIAQIIESGPAKAIPALERAVAEDPTLPLSFNMLGFCYFTQGDMTKAAKAYGQASDLSPQTRLFAHSAAVAFDRAGNAEQATVYAARAVALPAANDADHDLYGKLLANAGKRDDAIRELQEAVALNPNLEEAYYLLGRTYLQAGDSAQSNAWFEKLKQVKQSNRTAGEHAPPEAKPASSLILLQGAPASPNTP
jgi:tetratricopeptide (TPR) repeat protein